MEPSAAFSFASVPIRSLGRSARCVDSTARTAKIITNAFEQNGVIVFDLCAVVLAPFKRSLGKLNNDYNPTFYVRGR